MKSSESIRSLRGNNAEIVAAEEYNGIRSSVDEYDVELADSLLEVKTCLSWAKSHYKYKTVGRFSINVDTHSLFKKTADEKGKMAIYVFYLIPRYNNRLSEINPENWIKAWAKWKDVDSLVKKTNRIARDVVESDGRIRYYYRIRADEIFGKNYRNYFNSSQP